MTVDFNTLLASIAVLPKEYIPTANALGRIIAEPVTASSMLPEADIAVMEGYAMRFSDLNAFPAALRVQGESNSAKPFRGTLDFGSAIKTQAGGRIAEGADVVVAMSKTRMDGDMVVIDASPVLGENICYAGTDFSPKEISFKPGTIMNASLVGLASAMHLLWLRVVRKPRVAVLAVGSELAMPGEANAKNPITASSLYSLPAYISASLGDPIILGIASDTVESVIEKIEEAANCDLLITTGGTSAGAGNLMTNALKQLSPDVKILKSELKRNDHMLFAQYKGMPICALPGNPISSNIYFSLYTRPIINKMLGAPPAPQRYAVLGRSLDEFDTSVDYLHASLSVDATGISRIIPVSAQDGFLLTELAKADCLLVVKQNKHLKKGDLVEFLPL